jgi:hypothetical protein
MKATKKQVTIECFKYDQMTVVDSNSEFYKLDWAIEAFRQNVIFFKDGEMYIKTLEGVHHASLGDYIIRGVNGELYPCKADIFEKTYDFENASQDFEFSHSFSWALEKVKAGYRIHRRGWNGKGMFVVYQKGYPQGIPCNVQTAQAWGMKPGELFRCEPYLQLKMVNGSHSMWVPSINDTLSDDWAIVKDSFGDIVTQVAKEFTASNRAV